MDELSLLITSTLLASTTLADTAPDRESLRHGVLDTGRTSRAGVTTVKQHLVFAYFTGTHGLTDRVELEVGGSFANAAHARARVSLLPRKTHLAGEWNASRHVDVVAAVADFGSLREVPCLSKGGLHGPKAGASCLDRTGVPALQLGTKFAFGPQNGKTTELVLLIVLLPSYRMVLPNLSITHRW